MEYLFFICINSFSRLIPHLPNMTSVGAMALFLSAKYSWKKSFVITFATMMISDMVLGFHGVMWATYGSFLIATILGNMLQKKTTRMWVVGITMVSSLQFFVITNFAVWMSGVLYPKTLSGLLDCYIMALPFFRNTLLGDLFYTVVFFGCFELVKAFQQKNTASLV